MPTTVPLQGGKRRGGKRVRGCVVGASGEKEEYEDMSVRVLVSMSVSVLMMC